jgi:catechol 2,3-dioxygenase-like lactoylglutathione lyase family enzyme
MIKGLGVATIWSEDLNNLLPFYREVLGLQVALQSPGFVLLGENVESGPNLGLGTHSEVKGRASDPYRHMVGLESDDVDAEYARLLSAGVEFIEKPADHDGVRVVTLKDPEGNIVQLL